MQLVYLDYREDAIVLGDVAYTVSVPSLMKLQ